MSLAEIQALWDRHERRQFPAGYRSQKFFNKNLTMWDSEIGGLILAFIQTGGRLGARQNLVMEQARSELPQIADQLEGDAKEYMHELAVLVDKVLQLAST